MRVNVLYDSEQLNNALRNEGTLSAICKKIIRSENRGRIPILSMVDEFDKVTLSNVNRYDYRYDIIQKMTVSRCCYQKDVGLKELSSSNPVLSIVGQSRFYAKVTSLRLECGECMRNKIYDNI